MKQLELTRTYPGPDVYMFANVGNSPKHAVSLHFDVPGSQFVAFFSADEARRMAEMFAAAAAQKEAA